MGYEIRKFKSFRGREGYGFNLELWKDGVKVAFVMDDASGGSYRFDWFDKKCEESFTAEAKAKFPDRQWEQGDGLLAEMVDDFTNARRLDRLAKKKTLFQVGAEIGSDTFHTISLPFDRKVHGFFFSQKYSGKKVFVYGHGVVQEAQVRL